MSNFDWSQFSAIMSSVTAIVAIIAPVVTSRLTIKSQERVKKMELYNVRVYDALADMANAYASLDTRDTSFGDEAEQRRLYLLSVEKCSNFRSTCLKIMSLVPVSAVRCKINLLLQDIGVSILSPTKEHDQIFYELIKDVNAYLLESRVKD